MPCLRMTVRENKSAGGETPREICENSGKHLSDGSFPFLLFTIVMTDLLSMIIRPP